MAKWGSILMVVLVAVPAALVAVPGVSAVTLQRYEGENRNRDAGACGGGESMTVWTGGFEGASGGKVLAYVNHGCWAEWDVNLASGASQLFIGAYGGASGECSAFDVKVDGASVGSTPSICGPFHPERLEVLGGGQSVSVSAGAHTVRVTVRTTAGPTWQNTPLDYLDFEAPCINQGPSTPAILGADGMGAGNYGWAGSAYVYQFQAQGSVDPDGDPVSYLWSWGDGQTTAGLGPAPHAYATTGARTITLAATDAPGARCPSASPMSSSATYVFTALSDWTVTLPRPGQGSVCAAGSTVRLGSTPNVVVANCKFVAEVATGGGVASLVGQVAFRVDGEVEFVDASSPFEYNFNGLSWDVFPLTRSVDAVASPVNDKYGRQFTSAEHDFLNVGLPGGEAAMPAGDAAA